MPAVSVALKSLMLHAKIVAIASIGIATFCAAKASRAQAAAASQKFEVASIRLNKDGAGGSIIRTPGGLTANNAEFSRLIEMAFQTRLIDLSQMPESLRSARFDIVAKAEEKISGDEYWQMLRALLEDRFNLKFHYEAKNVQLYALILVKNGGNLGPKISHSPDTDCPVNPDGTNFCGVNVRPVRMLGQRVAMPRIASELSAFAGRPVQDHTKLAGLFNFELIWTPDEYVSSDRQAKLLNGSPVDSSAPSFFAAIQQQLGLKLESQRGLVEILVIDHAENPSEN